MFDPIVDEVRRVREELIKQHGGLKGYIKHLQAIDRDQAGQMKRQAAKKAAATGKSRSAARRRATKKILPSLITKTRE